MNKPIRPAAGIAKKLVRPAVCAALAIGLMLSGFPALAASVRVSLPEFSITLNGTPIDNALRVHPFFVYNGITYFPMTYDDSRFLGLRSDYAPQTGLDIHATSVSLDYIVREAAARRPQQMTAQITNFPIRVNGQAIDNATENHPLLLYQNITYFPLTWRFAVNEFGWAYAFDSTHGLVIYSTPPEPIDPPSPEQVAGIVRDATEKLHSSEWLGATLRAYSRYENRVYGLINEHAPSATAWYRTVAMAGTDNAADPLVSGHYLRRGGLHFASDDGVAWTPLSEQDADAMGGSALRRLPDMLAALERLTEIAFDHAAGASDHARVDTTLGYPRLVLGYMEDEPSSMPWASPDGGINLGSINQHTFFFHLQERALLSYWVNAVHFLIDDDGGIMPHASSTTWYSIIDIDYDPFAIPAP